MLFDGKGFFGGFGSLELGVDGITLFSHGIDSGFLGVFVLGNGIVVLLDGSEPCGVPFSLNSDLLGSGVLGVEVEVSFGVSGLDKCHVFGKEFGTSSLGFLEGVLASEEAVVGEVGGLDGGGFRADGYSFFGSSFSVGGADTFFDVFVSFLSLAFGLHVAVVIALLASTGVVDLVGLTTPVIRAWA